MGVVAQIIETRREGVTMPEQFLQISGSHSTSATTMIALHFQAVFLLFHSWSLPL